MGDTHVALLRGINVGGRNKLPMAALRAIVAEAGATDVRTYIQSGNVVFRATPDVAARLAEVVSRAIAARFELDVPVVTRTAAAWARAFAANPFLADGVDEKRLHVAFLAERPAAEAVARLDPDRSPPDRVAVRGREVYLHLPNGAARTKYTNAYLDRCLGTTSTVRNWRTVGKLHALASE